MLEKWFHFTLSPAEQMYLSYSIIAHSLLYINRSFSVPIRLRWNSKWIRCVHLNDSVNHRLPSCLIIREPQCHLITIILPYFLDYWSVLSGSQNWEEWEGKVYLRQSQETGFINSDTTDDVARLEREWNIGSEVLYPLQGQRWFWHFSHSGELQKNKQVLAIWETTCQLQLLQTDSITSAWIVPGHQTSWRDP